MHRFAPGEVRLDLLPDKIVAGSMTSVLRIHCREVREKAEGNDCGLAHGANCGSHEEWIFQMWFEVKTSGICLMNRTVLGDIKHD